MYEAIGMMTNHTSNSAVSLWQDGLFGPISSKKPYCA
jgi:hypothetical protein